MAAVLTTVSLGASIDGADVAIRAVASADGRADALGYLVEEAGLVLGGGREERR